MFYPRSVTAWMDGSSSTNAPGFVCIHEITPTLFDGENGEAFKIAVFVGWGYFGGGDSIVIWSLLNPPS